MIYVRISRNLYNLEKVVGLKVVFLLRNAQFGSGFMPLNALDGSAIQALITILKLIFILLNFLKCFTCLCVCVCVFWSYVIVNNFNFSIIFMGHV